jgi:murein DD-endopeptidase MepM/ murein hydrolase activator NlpD
VLVAAAIILVAAILLSGACSSSEGSNDGAEATRTAAATATVDPATPEPTPSPAATAAGVLHTVVEGDTVLGIAQLYGSTVEGIVAANALSDPAAIRIGQVLVVPNGNAIFTPTPSPVPDPRLSGFTVPVAGACLPSSDNHMPNAPREYRAGVHEGVDFYTGYVCVDVPPGSPAVAAKAGTVVRADHDFVEMTLEELNAILARTQAQGYTDAEALNKFRGRQVWVDHGDGLVTRYCHLAGIPEGIAEGAKVSAGQPVGLVGDSGTPEAITNPGVEIHLHWEVRVDGSYLGAGLTTDEVRLAYERLFTE